MTLQFTEELFVMKMKNHTKIKVIEIELQKYRGVILHDTKEIYKF